LNWALPQLVSRAEPVAERFAQDSETINSGLRYN